METSLPTPMTARVYVNIPDGITYGHCGKPIEYTPRNGDDVRSTRVGYNPYRWCPLFLSQGGKEQRKNNWYHPVQGSAP